MASGASTSGAGQRGGVRQPANLSGHQKSQLLKEVLIACHRLVRPALGADHPAWRADRRLLDFRHFQRECSRERPGCRPKCRAKSDACARPRPAFAKHALAVEGLDFSRPETQKSQRPDLLGQLRQQHHHLFRFEGRQWQGERPDHHWFVQSRAALRGQAGKCLCDQHRQQHDHGVQTRSDLAVHHDQQRRELANRHHGGRRRHHLLCQRRQQHDYRLSKGADVSVAHDTVLCRIPRDRCAR